MAKLSRLEVIETGSRRRWTLEEKLRIIEESYRGARLVSSTARRHGLSANQLFVWRRLHREGKLASGTEEPGFVPAIVSPEESTIAKTGGHGGRIEIILSEPRRLIVDGEVNAVALARIVSALGGR